jgi:hypothetical protein
MRASQPSFKAAASEATGRFPVEAHHLLMLGDDAGLLYGGEFRGAHEGVGRHAGRGQQAGKFVGGRVRAGHGNQHRLGAEGGQVHRHVR